MNSDDNISTPCVGSSDGKAEPSPTNTEYFGAGKNNETNETFHSHEIENDKLSDEQSTPVPSKEQILN
jgi:hypothetical protein